MPEEKRTPSGRERTSGGYRYVREPLRGEEADLLSSACRTAQEKLIVWTLLDTGLRVSELCGMTAESIQWQQRQIRVKGKGGPFGKKTKLRTVADVAPGTGAPGAVVRAQRPLPGRSPAGAEDRQGNRQPGENLP